MKVLGFLVIILMISCVYKHEQPLSDSELSPYIKKFREHENQLDIIVQYLDSQKDNYHKTAKVTEENELLPNTIKSLVDTLEICYIWKFTNDIVNTNCEGNTSYTLQIGKA